MTCRCSSFHIVSYLTFKLPFQKVILFYLPAVGNPYCASVWVLRSFLNTICKLSASFITSKAVVCSPCLWTYVCRTCLCTVINFLGYLFCIFTAPALVVSPEVHADQGRGAAMFPAGFWRAADGDALRSDHLKPLWRLLPIQRDGAAIKPHISQTTWWREKKKRRRGKKEFTMSKDTLRHQSSGKIFYGHTFTPWQGCKLKYTDTLALTHINRLADTPADQRTHALSCVQTPKQPEAKLSAWTSFFCRIFSHEV